MIVRRDDDHLLLIAQPDHAAVAATLMSAWQEDGLPASPRRSIVLQATRHHDDGWRDVDMRPIVSPENGQILDFVSAPEDVRLGIWPRAVERLEGTPYVAALVAQHALAIYEPYRDRDGAQGFFARMEALRDRSLAKAAPMTAADLAADYFFVRMGDALSLAFCDLWTEPRRLAHYRIRLEGSALIVDPDPFGGRKVPLAVEARRLPHRSFSAREAAAAFDAAPRVTVTGVASGPRS